MSNLVLIPNLASQIKCRVTTLSYRPKTFKISSFSWFSSTVGVGVRVSCTSESTFKNSACYGHLSFCVDKVGTAHRTAQNRCQKPKSRAPKNSMWYRKTIVRITNYFLFTLFMTVGVRTYIQVGLKYTFSSFFPGTVVLNDFKNWFKELQKHLSFLYMVLKLLSKPLKIECFVHSSARNCCTTKRKSLTPHIHCQLFCYEAWNALAHNTIKSLRSLTEYVHDGNSKF